MTNVFYFDQINSIGGIETFFYQLGKKYGKDYDITLFYKSGDSAKVRQLSQFIRVKKFQPIPEQEKVYQRLFREYKILHDYFGRGGNDVMKRLKQIREEAGFSASGDHR